MVVFILFHTFLAVLHGMLDLPQPGIEPMSLHWEHGVLTTGPPDTPLPRYHVVGILLAGEL